MGTNTRPTWAVEVGEGVFEDGFPTYYGLSYSTPECVVEGFDPSRLTVRLVAHDDAHVAIEIANHGPEGVASAEVTPDTARHMARLLEVVAAKCVDCVGPRE